MPAVKGVGEPCAGEPHARFDGGREEPDSSRLCRAESAPLAYPAILLGWYCLGGFDYGLTMVRAEARPGGDREGDC